MVELTARHAGTSVDERAARAQLRRQIARLETQLSDVVVSAFPYGPVQIGGPVPGGPQVLDLGELERVRDALAARLAAARAQLDERGERQAACRALLERMLLEPDRHRFIRVANRDLGEPGCGVWHVRPRLGLIGMLAGWWQVKLSSGCPLAS
jgi:alpha-D-ribose 1-methylphosphonate 5-triphosphate synthase subunit PhnG